MGKKFTFVPSIFYNQFQRKKNKNRKMGRQKASEERGEGEGRRGVSCNLEKRKHFGLPVGAIFKIFNESLALAPHYNTA